MYKKFYGFLEKPFSISPDSEFLYFSKPYQVAYSMLEYGIYEQEGITVITGDAGVGKTTLIHHLLDCIDKDHFTVGLINNIPDKHFSLLPLVALSLNILFQDTEYFTLLDRIQAFLISQYAQGHDTVIIIDEAQILSAEVLEELRLLTNINVKKDQLVKMVLVGQSELKQRLLEPALLPLRQRITSEYHLGPLDIDEVKSYITYRLHHAGVERPLFDNQAMDAIADYSHGIPRLINKLCDFTLVVGFAKGLHVINQEAVEEVILANTLGGFKAPNKQGAIKEFQPVVSRNQAEESCQAPIQTRQQPLTGKLETV